jgi:sugar lactone lactonase YvrE
MTCSPDGTIYLIDRSDLIRVSGDGRMRVLAENLSGEQSKLNQRHKVQGLCADEAGNVWVAVYEQREIKKISPDGEVTVVARSPAPYKPSGVLATPDGHLWVLEDSLPDRARIRHIAPDGKERQY